MGRRTTTWALAAAAMGVFLAGGPALAEDLTATEQAGLALLDKNCAACHAVGPTGASRLPQAPTFREVVTRYPAETLAEALAEGIVTGHEDMPAFVFQPEEIDQIIAYLETMEPKN